MTTATLDLASSFTGWAQSVQNTLVEAQAWGGEQPSPQDLYGAFLTLAQPREGDDGQTASRRLTCGAIANSVARTAGFRAGNPANAAGWFARVAAGATARAEELGQEGGRFRAIAATWAREAAELGG